jgi:hypothetical protein
MSFGSGVEITSGVGRFLKIPSSIPDIFVFMDR